MAWIAMRVHALQVLIFAVAIGLSLSCVFAGDDDKKEVLQVETETEAEARFRPRILVERTNSCVQPGFGKDGQVIATTPARKCPCYVRHALFNNLRPASTAVDFLVMRVENFRKWTGKGILRYEEKYSAVEASPRDYSMVLGLYYFQTRNMEIVEDDEFVLIIRASTDIEDCDTSVAYVFESIPAPCDERLPNPHASAKPSAPALPTPSASALPSGNTPLASTGTPDPALVPPTPTESSLSSSDESGRKKKEYTVATPRIVAGRDVTDITIRSFMASIRSSTGECSGTVISPRYVVTAAHCGVRVGARVRIGGSTSSSGAAHTVSEVTSHPEYIYSAASGLSVHDIALLRVNPVIQNASHVLLNDDSDGPSPGQYVRAAGYGQTSEDWPGVSSSRALQEVDVPAVSFAECKFAYEKVNATPVVNALQAKAHFCAGFLGDASCGGDTCNGDSGGPVVRRALRDAKRFVQVGITSGGIGCARRGLPGVYTRAASYVAWVRNVTGEDIETESVYGKDDSIEKEIGNSDTNLRGVRDTTTVVRVVVPAVIAGALVFAAVAAVAVLIVVRIRRNGQVREEKVNGTSEGTMTKDTKVGNARTVAAAIEV